MAESVARVRILAQVEGLEGFDKLKSAFRGLQQAIGPADAELAKARKQILAFGEAGARTEQVIKGQIEALKALQSQSAIGGNVYRQLSRDLKTLGDAYRETAGEVKRLSDAQLRNQASSNRPSAFQAQIAVLKRDLSELNVLSREYATALANIQRREIRFGMGSARQGVIARNQAFENENFLQPDRLSGQPELPGTTAALNQRIAELSDRLNNLTRGGERWIQTSREITQVQRALNQEFANPAVEAARRRLEASRNTSSGFLAFSTGLEDRLAVQKSIARNQRTREAEALARSGPMQGPPAPSELFQGIAGIGNQTAANQLQLMGRSYQEVANSIRQTAGASDGSLGSLQRQRAAWEQLRATISPLDKEYAQIEREARKAIAAADKQIGRRQIGNRGGAGQIGQGTGAIAASGIFGGPEGFLGSAGGAALGAVLGGPAGFATGAFLGGSVGAYAGMGRQALGGMSTYAADIQKQEIALKGITKTQQEYARALAASAAVTRDFNVPQLEATRGITQLSAAVIGAGGKVTDAEVVFRNVTAAIKATGGSSEDVQGSLTALSQIFSKGKVSAEELQGQLGERLPGAVTMFAKATGRTLPQLQKDLEQGVVGLADLMKFVVSDQGLGQFEQGAKRVASSSAEAGARLTATWNDTRRAIGDALLPLTAQIQDSLGNALRDATPALIDLAKALAGTVKLLVDNAGAIAAVAKVILGISTVAAAGFGFVKAAALIGTVTTAVTQLGGAMGVATLATRGLSVALLSVSPIGWIGAAIAGLGLLAKAVYDTNDTFKSWVDNIGGVVANDFKAAINGMKEDAKSVFDFIGDLLPDYEEKSAKSQANVSDGWTSTFASIRDGALGFATDIQKAFAGLFDTLPPWARKFLIDNAAGTSAGLAVRVANYVKDASGRAVTKGVVSNSYVTGTEYMGPGGAPGKTSLPDDVLTRWETTQQQKKDKEDKDRLRQEQLQQQTDEALAKARIAFDDAVHRNAMELIRKRYEYEQELAGKQRDNWVKSLTGAARSAGGLISGFLGEFDQLSNRLVQQQETVSAAAQKLKSAQAMSSVTVGGTGGTGVGFSASQLQAAAREASKFTGIANMCSESVKAFYKSLGITLPGVTAWADTVRKAGQVMTDWSKLQAGDIVATGRPGDTPHVGVYTGGDSVFHQSRNRGLKAGNYPDLNYFKQGGYFVRPSAMGGGTGAAARRDIGAEGQADVAGVDLQSAQAIAKLTKDQIEQLKKLVGEGFVLDFTDQIRQQNAEMANSAQIIGLRNRLQLEGQRPEYIEGEIKKAQVAQEIAQKNDVARQALERLTAAGESGSPVAKEFAAGIAENNTQLAEFKRLTDEATAAQIAFNDAMRFRQDTNIGAGLREGAESYIESIGTMREATAQLAQTGIKGVEDAIFSLVTTGTANFREFAADILKQTARMIIQQLILRTIMQAIGAIGGGGPSLSPSAPGGDWMGAVGRMNPTAGYAMGGAFGKNNIIPFATGGIVDKPTLFKFANGGAMRTGLMGEAGPEAIIPLKRGRDGKLGVSGGGGGDINVSVSVDATGSQVQGNAGQGEQLGRAISQAVQAELVKQKRPGGLLAA